MIRVIELRGLERQSEGEVRAQIQLKEGDTYSAESLAQAYERLWRSGQFVSIQEPEVYVENQGVRIVITFLERQRISSVTIEGVDGGRLSDLRAKLLSRSGGLLNPRDLERDVQTITRFYRELGFFFVRVEESHEPAATPSAPRPTAEPSPAEPRPPESVALPLTNVPVTFRVFPGPRVRVAQIRFHGNASFPDSALLKFMATRERSSFLGIPNAGLFDRDRYQQDLANLQSFYVFKGYFDAVVAAEDFSFNVERDQLYVGIRIFEGQRYRVTDVSFDIAGPPIFPESTLLQEVRVQRGMLYDEEEVQADVTRLIRLYSRNAYIESTVERKLVYARQGNEVAIQYRIQQGSQAYVEEIEIRGNVETKDKVIRRELTFYPGEQVNLDKIRESQSNLYRLQYFGRVEASYEPGSTPSQKKVVVEVEEQSTGSLNFGFGVTSGQGLVGILSVTKRNFDITDVPEQLSDFTNAWVGGGQTLALRAQPGTRDSRYHVEFREPYLFDTRYSLFLRGFRTIADRSDFDEKRVAGEIGLGHRFVWDDHLVAEAGYRYEVIDIGNIDADAAPDVFRVQGNNVLSALVSEARYDRREFTLRGLVVGGWSASIGYEYIGGFLGGDVDINKARASLDVYHTLYSQDDKKHHVLSLKNTFLWADFRQNTREVPIFERYFLGGARSLRGFRFRDVGPHFNRDPLGGAGAHYGSLEYTFPLVEDFLRGLMFADFGNLDTQLQTLAFQRYRLTLGGGVLLNVNLFGQQIPISLTWGEAVASEEEDRERLFLFDIGTTF
ncbi:MAG: outer membrane protein assembly factor BamA [Planctomycetota bacterium]